MRRGVLGGSFFSVLAAVPATWGCGRAAASSSTPAATSDDPGACGQCHSSDYAQWAPSAHARAGDDPIFLAMNARGQRETSGALGDFCVRCHAPLALSRGETTDGLDLGAIAADLKGVTCVVCHTADSPASASLDLTDDGVMRGPLTDPQSTTAHPSRYSPFHDRVQAVSADLCGACHAVTNGHGLEVERTIDEWRATTYANDGTLRTCGRCHMAESLGAAVDGAGAPQRPVHDHSMAGVDLGMPPTQATAVQDEIDPTLSAELCVVPGESGAAISVTLENALVGHDWPSGATQNRRAWLELVGYAAGAVVYQSGVVSAEQAVTDATDPPLIVLRDQLYDEKGQPTAFMWSATTAQSNLLAPATADPAHSIQVATANAPASVDRVTARVLVRAIDYDVADSLVASGDLSPQLAASLPTLALRATVLEWTSDRGAACLP